MVSPILVALDFASASEALAMARLVRPHVGGFKVGLELIMAEGPGVIDTVSDLGLPIFVDAKLHDIPTTVERAAYQLGKRGARWVTAHCQGGLPMLEAAVAGLTAGTDGEAGVLGVTTLTSVDPEAEEQIGPGGQPNADVRSLTLLAELAGAEGVVCAVDDVAAVKHTSSSLIAVTPGIRLAGDGPDDQARVATPIAARMAGADWLVIGRSITQSKDPAATAKSIAEEIAELV